MATYPYSLPIQNPATSTTTTGWTNTSGTLGTRTTNPTPPSGATGYFTGGATVTMVAYQDVAIPVDYHADIDAGLVRLEAGFQLAAFEMDDQPYVRVEARDGGGAVLAAVVDTESPVKYATIPSTWRVHLRGDMLPAGTRTIRYILTSRRGNGTNNDGYFSSLTGTLTTPTTLDVAKVAVSTVMGIPARLAVGKISVATVMGLPLTLGIAKIAVATVTGLTVGTVRKPWLVILDADVS